MRDLLRGLRCMRLLDRDLLPGLIVDALLLKFPIPACYGILIVLDPAVPKNLTSNAFTSST